MISTTPIRKILLTLKEALVAKNVSHGYYNTYNIIHPEDTDLLIYT